MGDWNDYQFQNELGHGASGKANIGIKISTGQKVVIKTFFHKWITSIKKEVKLLLTVQDHSFISELVDVIESPDTGLTSIIYNYYESTKTALVLSTLTDIGNKRFLFKILNALNYANSKGVIHGGIKPQNIICNVEAEMFKLIDWGKSNYYKPGAYFPYRIGTKFNHRNYQKVFFSP